MPNTPSPFDDIVDRYLRASDGFGRLLELVTAKQWGSPTPCAEWSIRDLVNHIVRGNLNYSLLGRGGSAIDFLANRDTEALGADPMRSFTNSWQECAEVFDQPGTLERLVNYPMGRVPGRQALAIRTVDNLVHTWDLARALGEDEVLNAELVDWAVVNLSAVYGDLPEMPTDAASTHRFFAPSLDGQDGTSQELLLRLTGREPNAWPSAC